MYEHMIKGVWVIIMAKYVLFILAIKSLFTNINTIVYILDSHPPTTQWKDRVIVSSNR
jgi:hypothetical protein